MLALLLPLVNATTQAATTPVELGRVSWQGDHDAAFRSARESGKPVLLFFQEVPG